MMNGPEKSDPAIVAMKPTNKAGQPAAVRSAAEPNAAEPARDETRVPTATAWRCMTASGRVSRMRRGSTAALNCTRDEGGPFEAGSQVLA